MSESEQAKEAPAKVQGTGPDAAASTPPLPNIDIAGTFGMPRSRQRRNWVLSLSAAVATHLFVLCALWPRLSDVTGVGGGDLTGIEVDIVSIAAIETPVAQERAPGTGAEVAVFGGAGAVTAPVNQEASDDTEDRQRKMPLPDPAPETTELLALTTPEPVEADPPPSAPAEAAQQAEAGGAAAPGLPTAAIAMGSGEGLSPGVIQRYKGEVVQRLAMRKPNITVHAQGEVVIEFTIVDTGEVRDARIAASSGHKVLDEAALSAVQTTRFPTPPRGINPALLTYRVPYYFRPPMKR